MSRNELQAVVDRSSTEDRLSLSAYLQHLATRDDPTAQTELTNTHRKITRGKKVNLRQLKRLHRTLASASLCSGSHPTMWLSPSRDGGLQRSRETRT